MDKQLKTLSVILILVFGINVAYSFYFRITPAADARAYDNIAWNIVLGNGYRETLDTLIQQDNSIIRIGPGYEVFLAAIYYVFGHHYEVVWIIQALLSALSALIVFFITKEIFGVNWNYIIGISAAVLTGFSPDLITMQGMLMTETLVIFLIVLSSYLFCRYYNAGVKSWTQALLLGLIIGLATLVRTPAAFLFFPVAFYFLTIKKFRHLLLMGAVIAVIFSPWIIRNYRVYGVFVPTNAAVGFNLLTGNHPGASGEQGDFSVLDQYPPGLNGIQLNELATGDAIKFILNNPFEFLKLTFYRTSIYFSFARPTGFWFHLYSWDKIITLVFSAAYSAILFILGFLGIWQIKNLEIKEKKLAKFILAMLVMMPLAIIGIIIETRYRMLAYPFFAVFAGYGIYSLWQRKIEWKSVFYIVLLLSANTLFDTLRNFGRIIGRIQDLIK